MNPKEIAEWILERPEGTTDATWHPEKTLARAYLNLLKTSDKFCSTDCMNRCLNYRGCLEDLNHYESAYKKLRAIAYKKPQSKS